MGILETVVTAVLGLAACTAVGGPAPAGIPIQPGERIQAYVDAHPEGTTFVLKAGVHRRQVIVPKRKDVFWGEAGAVLDGEHVAPVAFDTRAATPDSVTIRNLVIEHYAPGAHQGAVQGDNGEGWLVEGNEVRGNAQAGIRVGPHARVLRNRVHRNGVLGIGGYRAHGALVAENEVYANNTSRSDPDTPTGEASGMKFADTDGLTVRGNSVHHNAGVGIWCDLGCVHVRYEQNTVSDNSHRGIFHEVSYDAVIRGNVVERNQPGGGPAGWPSAAGIVVVASPNVEVTDNIVRDNGDGITALQEDRGRGPRGPYVVENLLVRGNDVRMPRGATGLVQAAGAAQSLAGRNNRFEGNRYHLAGNATPFYWLGAARTEAQWRGYGQDAGGTFTR